MDKKSGLLYISISVMVVVVIVLGVILTLDREEPNIYVQTEVNQKDIYWNLQTPIRVEVADKSKLKSFETILIADQKEYVLENELVNEDSNSGILTFEIKPFKATDGFKATNAILRVKAKDSSSWNFFDGNEAIKDTNLIIDRRSPQASVISNSYMIKQGGKIFVILSNLFKKSKFFGKSELILKTLCFILFSANKFDKAKALPIESGSGFT